MAADIFDLPVDVPEQAEGAAFGAALQALWAHRCAEGDDLPISRLTDEHVRIDAHHSARPKPDAAATYRELYATFQRHLGSAIRMHGPAGGQRDESESPSFAERTP
jgi:xylulokinase